MKAFNDLADFSAEEISELLNLARRLDNHPEPEALRGIASYGDAIGIRAFAQRRNLQHDLAETEFRSMTDLIDKPYINMESATNHPCQCLADWLTLDDFDVPANGGKFVLSWAFHPRPLPLAVPASTLHMAAARGMDITVLRPDGFELPAAIMQKAQFAAEASGGSVRDQILWRPRRRSEAARGTYRLVCGRAVVRQCSRRLSLYALSSCPSWCGRER